MIHVGGLAPVLGGGPRSPVPRPLPPPNVDPQVDGLAPIGRTMQLVLPMRKCPDSGLLSSESEPNSHRARSSCARSASARSSSSFIWPPRTILRILRNQPSTKRKGGVAMTNRRAMRAVIGFVASLLTALVPAHAATWRDDAPRPDGGVGGYELSDSTQTFQVFASDRGLVFASLAGRSPAWRVTIEPEALGRPSIEAGQDDVTLAYG